MTSGLYQQFLEVLVITWHQRTALLPIIAVERLKIRSKHALAHLDVQLSSPSPLSNQLLRLFGYLNISVIGEIMQNVDGMEFGRGAARCRV